MEGAAAATSTSLSIVVPKEYPLILLACAILCVECFSMGFVVARARVKTFTKEFMSQFT